ncbi:MAG: hypothetical protein FJ109_21575, partial [Deltaproteobacteria bacterium]|nr:hypothetical protein [Deltaproteobacteria bacterium]
MDAGYGSVSVPRIQLKSEVTHCTPRRATAIERAVLMVARRLAVEPAWQELSLAGFFERYLQVPDPAPLIEHSLDELRSVGLVKVDTSISAGQVRIGQLAISTDSGAAPLDDELVPTKPRQDIVFHQWDPIRSKLERTGGVARGGRPEASHLAAEVFRDAYPGVLVRQSVTQEDHAWRRSRTLVKGVRELGRIIIWSSARL